ncbi:MAG: hypothetical protein JO324_02940 [Candidatus Eremiobacteraeota bacterium]|nr:hypothetical protein [Candidatus Eremiobacteraeota bacterium]
MKLSRKAFVLGMASMASLATLRGEADETALSFNFKSSFWVNLHHRLFMQAQATAEQRQSPLQPGGSSWNALAFASLHEMQLNAEQGSQWARAVDRYASYADFELLDPPMPGIAAALAIADEAVPAAGPTLHPPLVEALLIAADVYRNTQWPADDRLNRQWITEVEQRAATVSPAMTASLQAAYGDPFPVGPFRVDVTTFANWAGCYTNTDPIQIFISPRDLRNTVTHKSVPNRGELSFELLFHEASHTVVTPGYGAIGRGIEDAATRLGVHEPAGLWHAFIFYTAGAVARRQLGNAKYKMAAEVLDLWSGPWKDYGKALAQHWQPFLDGKDTRSASIDNVVMSIGS